MIGVTVGSLLGLIIAVAPSILILRNKNTSGKTKAFWFIGALIIPFIVKFIVSVTVIAVQGHSMPAGFSFLIPISWYITAWAIYFYFKSKHKMNNETRNQIPSKAES